MSRSKNLFDIFVSSAGIIIFAPLLMLAAAAVAVSSGTPVLFRQRRVGLHGKEFMICKFRTMVRNAPRLGTSVTTGNDRRVTPVGKFLRRTKLDELPQLFNVLRNEMSLVGPRPEVPEIVAGYSPEMRRVLEVKPGITGLATLHLRDEENLLAKVAEPDAFYVKVLAPLKVRLAMEHAVRDSFWFDLGILVRTVWMITPLRFFYKVKDHPLVSEMKRGLV